MQLAGLHDCGLQGFTTGWQFVGPQFCPGPHTCGEQETPWQPDAEFNATAPRITGGVYTAIRNNRRLAASIFSSLFSAIGDPLGGNLADNGEWFEGMLPIVDPVFTLLRQLASQSVIPDASAAKLSVQRHGFGPLLARAGHVAYRADLARATLAWRNIELLLPPVVSALVGRGVAVAPIKGVSYATTLYAVPAERPMSDVDLLVDHQHVAAAVRTFRELGFQPAQAAVLHHAAPWVRGDFVIDLHWNIVPPGRARIDLTGVWSRMGTGWPEGACRLEHNDAVLFHLLHLVRNRMLLPLINVIDYTRLLERASLSVVLDRACEWRARNAVAAALRFCRDVLDDTVARPGGWSGPSRDDLAELREPSSVRKIVFDVATASSPREVVSRAAHTAANRTLAMIRRGRQGAGD